MDDDEHKIETDQRMDLSDMSRGDIAAWALGLFRTHMLQLCDHLEREGGGYIPVESLREYVTLIDMRIEIDGE